MSIRRDRITALFGEITDELSPKELRDLMASLIDHVQHTTGLVIADFSAGDGDCDLHIVDGSCTPPCINDKRIQINIGTI